MRPPLSTFPRRITVTPRPTRTSDRMVPGVPVPDVPAYFDDRQTTVSDEREGTGPGEVTATGFVMTYTEGYAAPGSLITTRPGTPHERTDTVVAAALFDDPRGPEHAEMWTI